MPGQLKALLSCFVVGQLCALQHGLVEALRSTSISEGLLNLSDYSNESEGSDSFAATDLYIPPVEGWDCHPEKTHALQWKQYCALQGVPKSWAMTSSCKTGAAAKGHGVGVTKKALQKCENRANNRTCYTWDNNGRKCFGDYHASQAEEPWRRYCKSHLPKAWFASADGSKKAASLGGEDPVGRARASCEEQAGAGNCRLFDDGGHSLAPRCMPACQQRYSQWCWATAGAELLIYWKPDVFIAKGADSCQGLTCQIATEIVGGNRTCCTDRDEDGHAEEWTDACNEPKNIAPLARWLKKETGKNYVYRQYVPGEERLKDILKRGPIVLLVNWLSDNSGHFVTLAGTDDNGTYWAHDPWNLNQAGKYEVLTYPELRNYVAPGSGKKANWTWTMYVA